MIILYVMNDTDTELESIIIPSKWEDRDYDIVVQARIDEELGLKSKFELD